MKRKHTNDDYNADIDAFDYDAIDDNSNNELINLHNNPLNNSVQQNNREKVATKNFNVQYYKVKNIDKMTITKNEKLKTNSKNNNNINSKNNNTKISSKNNNDSFTLYISIYFLKEEWEFDCYNKEEIKFIQKNIFKSRYFAVKQKNNMKKIKLIK